MIDFLKFYITDNSTIQHLENSVADLEDRLKETEI